MTDAGDSQEASHRLLGRLRSFYRRRPVLAWGSTAVVAGAVVATVVILALGDGGEPANAAIKCSVYDSDAGLSFTFAGKVTRKEADEGCATVAQQLSSANSYWRIGLPPAPKAEPKLVCALEVPANGNQSGVAYIESNPESFSSLGTEMCGVLAHEGWTEALAPTGGPWIHAWRKERARAEAVEAEEQETREAESAEREEREQALYTCEEDARAREESEDDAIESETQERLKASSGGFEVELEIEEEGWAKEEAAEDRREAAVERCERAVEGEPGAVNPEGGTEYR